jgi:hypothetical protein
MDLQSVGKRLPADCKSAGALAAGALAAGALTAGARRWRSGLLWKISGNLHRFVFVAE